MPITTEFPLTTYINVGSVRIRASIENSGAGRTLLLINGIGASGDLFEPFRAELDDRATIAFDAPGVGGSETPALAMSMRRLARTVDELCDDFDATRVDVLGVSWGGLLAQELARRHPERVRRLVLVATSTGWTSLPGNIDALSTLLSPVRYFSADNLRRVAPLLYGSEISEHPELLDRQIELRLSHPPSWVGYMQQLQALAGWSSLPWLHRLEMPTLVLAGDEDAIVPLGNARVLASRIADAEFEVAKGAGHLFMLTRPVDTAAVVRRFLDA